MLAATHGACSATIDQQQRAMQCPSLDNHIKCVGTQHCRPPPIAVAAAQRMREIAPLPLSSTLKAAAARLTSSQTKADERTLQRGCEMTWACEISDGACTPLRGLGVCLVQTTGIQYVIRQVFHRQGKQRVPESRPAAICAITGRWPICCPGRYMTERNLERFWAVMRHRAAERDQHSTTQGHTRLLCCGDNLCEASQLLLTMLACCRPRHNSSVVA